MTKTINWLALATPIIEQHLTEIAFAKQQKAAAIAEAERHYAQTRLLAGAQLQAAFNRFQMAIAEAPDYEKPDTETTAKLDYLFTEARLS